MVSLGGKELMSHELATCTIPVSLEGVESGYEEIGRHQEVLVTFTCMCAFLYILISLTSIKMSKIQLGLAANYYNKQTNC